MPTLFSSLFPYLRLMRLHQRAGIWLLLWPCWWGYALACGGRPNPLTLALFLLGAVVMRGVGCVFNDMVDRKIDAQVERTRMRPLASGELSMLQAVPLLVLLLLAGLAVALAMGKAVLLWAASALALVFTYPFMKRITWWPQLFLGFTFNWGALLGFVAAGRPVGVAALALYAGCIAWTLGYDTIYAHQDKSDDARIGVKSTALRLGGDTKHWCGGFYVITLAGLVISGHASAMQPIYYAFLLLTAAHFACQLRKLDLDNRSSCRTVFISNAWLGWFPFLGMLLSGQ